MPADTADAPSRADALAAFRELLRQHVPDPVVRWMIYEAGIHYAHAAAMETVRDFEAAIKRTLTFR